MKPYADTHERRKSHTEQFSRSQRGFRDLALMMLAVYAVVLVLL